MSVTESANWEFYELLAGEIASVPAGHAASHEVGGSDEILLNLLGNPNGNVQFSQKQALQFVIENRTSDPGSPVTGQIWLRTDL